MICAIYEHRVRIRNVESGFHDHGRHENVGLAVDELPHHFLEIALAHLSMANADSRARNQSLHMRRDRIDRLDTIVDEEYLPTAIELPGNSLLDQSIVPRLDEREHWRSVARRSLHQCHVAQAGE